MSIYSKKPVAVAHKIVRLPKSRLERLKIELVELKQGLRDFFSAAPLWEWIIGGVVVFGTYSYFAGYFSDFWTSLNPLYR
jgi:hypothetical protein